MSGSAGWWRSSATANNGTINKETKHTAEGQRGEINRRKKGKVDEALIIIQKKSDVVGVEFLLVFYPGSDGEDTQG